MKGVLSLATLASLAFLGLTAYRYVQHSGELNLGEVRIMGCIHVPESELLDMTRLDLRSNLLNLDLQEVSRRLTQHPWVEKAQVRRDFSGRALIIEVQERVPCAMILLDELYLMDRNGEIFKKAAPKENLNFPVMTGLSLQEWKQGNSQALRLLHQGLELLDLLQGRKAFTARDVSEIHLSKKDGLTLYLLEGGIPIRFGTGDYEDKLNRLEKVLPDLRNKLERVEYLVLTYPKKVVVKMKEGGAKKS
jgi:cell division protein FtsQ